MNNSYPFQQLRANPTSYRLAIKSMCAHCAGGPSNDLQLEEKQYDSDWKATIKGCPSVGCPLHKLRPYRRVDRTSSNDTSPTLDDREGVDLEVMN